MMVQNNSSILSDYYNKSSLKDNRSEGVDKALMELQARDQEVRAHEAAHRSVGGSLASGADFSYQKGSDGKMYAIGGEVSIDTSEGKTPEETIQRAAQIQAAALAPATPSPQDVKVAGAAAQMLAKAQIELSQQKREESMQRGLAVYGEQAVNITA